MNLSIKKTIHRFTTTFLIYILSACSVTPTTYSPNILKLHPNKLLTIRTSPTLTLSPNGEMVVYPADTTNSDIRQLYLQPTNGQEGKILKGTVGGGMPFFSPDGKWVGFFAEGKLKKTSIENSKVEIISNVNSPMGGTWGINNMIVFADGPLWQVSAKGGTPSQVTQLRAGEQHSWPSLLPNGKLLYNFFEQNRTVPAIAIQEVGSNNRTILLKEGNYPRYSKNGDLIYNINGSLKAAPLDINKNFLTDNPFVISDGVLLSASSGAAQYSVSQSGALIFVPGKIFGESRRIVFLDHHGNERDSGLPSRRYSYVRYSPDGQFLAIEASPNILIYDFGSQSNLKIIENASYPVWGPNENEITFSSARNGIPGLYQAHINNSNATKALITSEYRLDHSYSWSTDGTLLVYTELQLDTGMDIWLYKKNTTPEPLLNSSSNECCPVFSPDKSFIAYISDEAGTPELYLKSILNSESTRQLSNNGAREPVWSHDGKKIFYWQDRQFMVVEIEIGSSIKIGLPRTLFEGTFVSSTSTWRPRFDISPTDDEFVIIRRGDEEMGVGSLHYITNWKEKLL